MEKHALPAGASFPGHGEGHRLVLVIEERWPSGNAKRVELWCDACQLKVAEALHLDDGWLDLVAPPGSDG